MELKNWVYASGRRPRRVLTAAIALLVVVLGMVQQPFSGKSGLLGGVAHAAGGASLGVSLTTGTAASMVDGWTISKTVNGGSSASITPPANGTGSATWVVTVTHYATLTGSACVSDTGNAATQNLNLTVWVTTNGNNPPQVGPTVTVPLGTHTVLQANETECYPFTIQVPWSTTTNGVTTDLSCGSTYKVYAHPTITNHSGHLGEVYGPTGSTTTTFNCSNPTVTVTDALFGFSQSGVASDTSWTFTRAYGCGLTRQYVNTAAITQTNQTASATLTVNQSTCTGTPAYVSRAHVAKVHGSLVFRWRLSAARVLVAGFNVRSSSSGRLNRALIRTHTGRNYSFRSPYKPGPYTVQIVLMSGRVVWAPIR